MTDEKRKFRRRKLILTLFHIIFVAMSVFGISAMYLFFEPTALFQRHLAQFWKARLPQGTGMSGIVRHGHLVIAETLNVLVRTKVQIDLSSSETIFETNRHR